MYWSGSEPTSRLRSSLSCDESMLPLREYRPEVRVVVCERVIVKEGTEDI